MKRLSVPQTSERRPGEELMTEKVNVQILKNGPIIIRGDVTLKNAEGHDIELPSLGGSLALCRCGGSKKKPFCDGEHKKIGFEAP